MGFKLIVIAVTVNGESYQLESAITLQQLLEQLQLAEKRLALERNGEIVPRSRLQLERINEGDKFEIVIAVGGG